MRTVQIQKWALWGESGVIKRERICDSSGSASAFEGFLISRQDKTDHFVSCSPSGQISAVLSAGLSYFPLHFTHISNKQR